MKLKKYFDQYEGSSAAGIGAFFGFLFGVAACSIAYYLILKAG